MVIGGSASPETMIEGFSARHGLEVIHAWGMTETNPLGTVARVKHHLDKLSPEERQPFLEAMGLTESGLVRLVTAAYHLLGLMSYFTAGEKEVRAWTIHRGDKAPVAAGVIHSELEKGFIRAETVGYEDFIRTGGWKGAREQGLDLPMLA